MEPASILFFLFLVFRQGFSSSGSDIQLSFSNFSSTSFDHVDAEAVLTPHSVVKIIVTDIPLDVDFLIIQVHSHFYEVVLSFDSLPTPEKSVNGTNVGLFYRNGPPVLYLKNPNNINVSVLAAAVPYSDESPVPGGCNLEAPLAIKPFLSLTASPAMISVSGSPASALTGYDNCDMNPFAYLMFYKFISERDFSLTSYFNAIRSMLTYPRILNDSLVAPEPIEGPALQRHFSRYSGTGTVYSLIVFNKFGNVAVYIPTFTYGCDNSLDDRPCQLLSSPLLKIHFAILIMLSAFICFAGHRYFLVELFYMGSLTGTFVSFALLSTLSATLSGDLLLLSSGIGLVFGVLWVCVWWFVSSPILSVALPFLVNGVLMSSTFIFYFMPGFTIMQNDLNYWLTFSVFVLVILLVSTTSPVAFNILACSFVGSYGVIFPIDYYVGSSLKYILMNLIRRATVDGFHLAATQAPLQFSDWILIGTWVIMTAGGCRSQRKLSANRSPFPPVCLVLWEPSPEPTSETSPILSNARFPTYS